MITQDILPRLKDSLEQSSEDKMTFRQYVIPVTKADDPRKYSEHMEILRNKLDNQKSSSPARKAVFFSTITRQRKLK